MSYCGNPYHHVVVNCSTPVSAARDLASNSFHRGIQKVNGSRVYERGKNEIIIIIIIIIIMQRHGV